MRHIIVEEKIWTVEAPEDADSGRLLSMMNGNPPSADMDAKIALSTLSYIGVPGKGKYAENVEHLKDWVGGLSDLTP